MEEYSDSKDKFNARRPKKQKKQKIYTGCDQKDFTVVLHKICKLLNIPVNENDSVTVRYVLCLLNSHPFCLEVKISEFST